MSDGPHLFIGEVRDPEKFQQAVLFFLHTLGPLSLRHLTYLLYQADFDHLEHHRQSITRATYYRGIPAHFSDQTEDGRWRLKLTGSISLARRSISRM